MIKDKENTYSDNQVVTATAPSTNVIDAGVANRDLGEGRDLDLIVVCTEDAASGGATTVEVALQDSADNSSFADVVKTAAIPKASLVAGTEVLRIALPAGLRRYTRLNYTVNTANLTTGKFTAFLTLDRQNNRSMPRGYSIT